MKSLSLDRPHLLVMVGLPGAGKSFFAEQFSSTFNAPLVSYDRIRTELFNEPIYSNDEQEIIGRVADYMLEELFKAGRTSIYDGPSGTRHDRQMILRKAIKSGYTPLFIWVQTEPLEARRRATRKNGDKPALTNAQYDALARKFYQPSHGEKAVVISGKHTYASQVKIVLKRLIQPRLDATKDINKPTPPPTPPSRPTPPTRNIFIR